MNRVKTFKKADGDAIKPSNFLREVASKKTIVLKDNDCMKSAKVEKAPVYRDDVCFAVRPQESRQLMLEIDVPVRLSYIHTMIRAKLYESIGNPVQRQRCFLAGGVIRCIN